MPNRLFLIDGHGLCYRAFYAVKALTNSKGQPTNAIFGFTNILVKLLNDLQPTHVAVCFDLSKKTHRQEKFADYKANRQAMPDELRAQLPIIRDVVEGFSIPMIELEGFEADDVMATLAKRFANVDTEVIIVTEDKDMGQMVGGNIKLYSPRQNKMIETKDVQEKFGVLPNQIADYIGIAGDTSDNIPGVFGIGEVGAKKLLNEFGSIENIYQNLDGMKASKLKDNLISGRANALLSKELATVDTAVKVNIDLNGLKRALPNRTHLAQLFKELEFKRLALEFQDVLQETTQEKQREALDFIDASYEGKPITIAYDYKNLLKNGKLPVKGNTVFDVFLADYCLSGGQGQYDLEEARGGEDSFKALFALQQRLMQEQGLLQLFNDIEMPLAEVLYRIEQTGVALDLDILKELSISGQEKITAIEKELYTLAGVTFNLNSPKQLSEVLFEKLKLPVIKKTKTGYSTDEEVLSRLAQKHPLPALILEYRQLAKLKSTYIDALPQLVNAHTKRIHTTFNQTGAETGRLSSTNPNLQNIPIRTDLGRQIRRAFIAYGKDDVLLSADYSQIELRVLAHLSADPALKKAFEANGDIHAYTASLMFDINQDKVDDKMRYAAKRVNFGIIYGISSFGLSKDLEVSIAQAQDFIDRYFLRYPNVRQFMDDEIKKASQQGYVTTMFGRRRYIPEINNSNVGIRQFAQRQAINTPVQGTAADMIKLAMVNIDKDIQAKKLKSRMVMTVHDELVFNVPKEELDVLKQLVVYQMEHVMKLSVPLVASVKSGLNWMEMKAL